MTTEPVDSSGTQLIAFLGFFDTDDENGVRSAVMVTNARGYPVELRVGTPVRPSAVQRALYGASLEPYVVSELIGPRLLNEIQRKPAATLTNRVGALGSDPRFGIIYIGYAETYIQTSDQESRRIEPVGGGEALVLVAPSEAAAQLDGAAVIVGSALKHFDPVEAFSRMETALVALADTDERYR